MSLGKLLLFSFGFVSTNIGIIFQVVLSVKTFQDCIEVPMSDMQKDFEYTKAVYEWIT